MRLLRRIISSFANSYLWDLAKPFLFKWAPLVLGAFLSLVARLEGVSWTLVFAVGLFGVTAGVWLANGLQWRRQNWMTETKRRALAHRISSAQTSAEVTAQRAELRAMYYSTTESAYRQIRTMLSNICEDLAKKDEATKIVGGMLTKRIEGADSVLQSLSQTLDADDTDEALQFEPNLTGEIFGIFFEKYQEVVRGVREGMRAHSGMTHLSHYPDYQEWLKADERFLGRLKEVIAKPNFEALRRRVRQVGWGESDRQD